MIFFWNVLDVHTLLRRSSKPPPTIIQLKLELSRKFASAISVLREYNAKSSHVHLQNPIKRYPSPYAKTIYFGLCTPRIHSKRKGQKFMNNLFCCCCCFCSFLSDLYEFQRVFDENLFYLFSRVLALCQRGFRSLCKFVQFAQRQPKRVFL